MYSSLAERLHRQFIVCGSSPRRGIGPWFSTTWFMATARSRASGPVLRAWTRRRGEAVRNILEKEEIGLVMHFAAFCYVGESVTDPLKYYLNNVGATLQLFQVHARCRGEAVVFSSTCATYGVPGRLPITEDLPQAPINPYARPSSTLRMRSGARPRPWAELRGLSLFQCCRRLRGRNDRRGPRSGDASQSRWRSRRPLAAALPCGFSAPDYPTPDGTCLRDYVHVDDLSRAHIAVFGRLATPGAHLFYNLGTGRPSSNREVIRAVEKISGRKVPLVEAPRRAGDPPALYADSGLAQRPSSAGR